MLTKSPFDLHNTTRSDAIKDLDLYIFEGLKYSIDNKNKKAVNIYVSLIYRLLKKSINNISLFIFRDLIKLPAQYYDYNMNVGNPFEKLSLTANFHFYELISIFIRIKFKDIKKEETKNGLVKILYYSFEGYNQLLYKIMQHLDHTSFINSMQQYNNIGLYLPAYLTRFKNLDIKDVEKINKQFATYYTDVLNGIQSWLWYLYYLERIDGVNLIRFSNHINLRRISNEEYLERMLFLTKDESKNYMDWDSWDYEIRKPFTSYTANDPMDWMPLGFLINSLMLQQFILDKSKIGSNELLGLSYLIDHLKIFGKNILKDFNKWKIVFDRIDAITLKNRFNNFINELSSIH